MRAVICRELGGPEVQLRDVKVPFSGKTWDTLSVGVTGSIAFGPRAPAGAAAPGGGAPGGGGRGGGVSIGRFDQLQDAARTLVFAQPAICVFMKPRMSGTMTSKCSASASMFRCHSYQKPGQPWISISGSPAP